MQSQWIGLRVRFLFFSLFHIMVETKKRSILLTIWLAIMLIGNFFALLTYLLFIPRIASYLRIHSLIFYIFGFLSLVNLICVVYLFMWKKKAFYVLCASAIVAFILNLIIGVGIIMVLFGLAGPVILYLLMKPQWNLFE
jgi:hypothetical protein